MEPHARIINETAAAAFRPLGVRRRGSSRLWYDDRGWNATCVEFAPSRHAKGTSVSVSICWLWYPQHYWTFDHRCFWEDFVEYESDESFGAAVRGMVARSAAEIGSHRSKLHRYSDALGFMDHSSTDGWKLLDRGIAAALANKNDLAISCLESISDPRADLDWVKNRSRNIALLLAILKNGGDVTTLVKDWIEQRRSALKLPALVGF